MDDVKIIALSEVSVEDEAHKFDFLLLEGEEIVKVYKSIRDLCVLTDRRLITVDVQGLRGKKREFMSIPYGKISAFSVETAGTFDLDGEVKLWLSGLGKFELGFTRNANVGEVAQILSRYIV